MVSMQSLARASKRTQMSITQEEEENDVQWMEYSTQKAMNKVAPPNAINSSQDNENSPNDLDNYNHVDNALCPTTSPRFLFCLQNI